MRESAPPRVPASAPAAFGIYVHWPFCLSKCPYCDFNSHVRHQAIDEPRYAGAFQREIDCIADRLPGRTVSSIFFGGGTPSLSSPRTIAAILNAIARRWTLAADVEISLEANPTSVDAPRFTGYRAAGVNRLSIGVQALDDSGLKALGRLHSAQEALAAIGVARSIFTRYSFDLIYARPGQQAADWSRELNRAIDEAAEHLSLYQLTIEKETPFASLHAAGKLVIPGEEEARELYELTQEVTSARGLPMYEVSNYARPGAECRHNLLYWRAGEYAGIGPGAHGRIHPGKDVIATATEKHPETWLAKVEREGHGLMSQERLSDEERGDEFLLMGLRLSEGIEPLRFAQLAGRPLDARRIDGLREQNLLEVTGEGRLRVTPEGVPVLDAIVAELAV